MCEGDRRESAPIELKGQTQMKKVVLSIAAALAVSVAASALAADMPAKAPKVAPAAAPSPWDIAFGAAVMNDYNFRGISQSAHGPAGFAYFEPRYNITPDVQVYGGIAATSVKLATDPTAEIDLYGGIRPTFGPVAFDFGALRLRRRIAFAGSATSSSSAGQRFSSRANARSPSR